METATGRETRVTTDHPAGTPTGTTVKITHKATTYTAAEKPTETTVTTVTGEADPQDKLKLKCISFNCNALKQNIDYIANLLTDCDILCLTENLAAPR